MEFFTEVMPILLYVVGFVLMIVFIIVGIRLIRLLDRIDRIADSVENKISSFDYAVDIMSKAANGIAGITDSVVYGVTSAVSKIFHKGKKEEEEDYE